MNYFLRKRAVKYGLPLLCFLLVKVFVLDIYHVPSGSMRTLLWEGDYILVNKAAYALRTPSSPLEIPLFNLLGLLPPLRRWFATTKWQPYTAFERLPARNEVVVFRAHFDSGLVLVKRCVALAGDSLHISEDSLFVNGKPAAAFPSVQYASVPYLRHTADSLRNYGPVRVPFLGQRIALDSTALRYYDDCLIFSEKYPFIDRNSKQLLPGYEATHTYRHNYFFALGDNRHYSIDSRTWDMVPTANLIGKPFLRLNYKRIFPVFVN